jgi:hypothetical protein
MDEEIKKYKFISVKMSVRINKQERQQIWTINSDKLNVF